MRATETTVWRIGACLICLALTGNVAQALHSLGTVVTVSQVFNATSGTTFVEPFAGTKFLILHFTSALEGTDRLIVNLGYDVDVFTAASGTDFWTRPIAGSVANITYIDDGNGIGSVTLDRYGRGENVDQGGSAGVGNADIFLLATPYTDPPPRTTGGLCGGAPPTWQNVHCLNPSVPAQMAMSNVARSVGMFVSAHEGSVSTCSAALIGPDLILTAGHCASAVGSSEGEEVDSGSFTLDFFTDCAGNRPPGYNPRVRSGFVRQACDSPPQLASAILQIDTGGTSLGVPILNLRSTPPASGEAVFGIHHPRGTPKKVSRQGLDPCSMIGSFGFTCDVDNGSSGSPVFDAIGNIIGVAITAGCSSGSGANGLTATASILSDISSSPPPCNPLSIVTVFDQSGSMQLPATSGSTETKLEAAQEAT